MTDKEILHKAILKAEEKGYKFPYWTILKGCQYKHHNKQINCDSYIFENICYNGAPIEEISEQFSIFNIIFSHDFAKALFGEEFEDYYLHDDPGSFEIKRTMPKWKHALQQLVLSQKPLKYLELFLND